MKKNIFMLTTIAMLLIAFTSCKNDDVATPAKPRTDIHLDSTSTTLGRRLVDKDGKSLYFFSDDVNGQSSCTGGCLGVWPVFLADATTTFGDGLLSGDFATITTSTGAQQTTYKGWPLYYYSPAGVQEAAGQVGGEGIGNIWFVAKPDYSIMIANYQLTGADGKNYTSTYALGDGRTNYFVDANGSTLYGFAKDSAFINKFTKPDFSNNAIWPIYETESIVVPSTLDKSLFVITTFNGKKQITYKGWPLYYYGPDGFIRGANKGITIPPTLPAGSIWFVGAKDAPLAPRL